MVALLKRHGTSLNDESLRTFLAEVEAIVNTRRITSESLSDVYSAVPLCPMQLLTMKSRVSMPPPGTFQKKIYIVGDSGDVCNTWQMNFGAGGRKKFMQPYKFVINGTKL